MKLCECGCGQPTPLAASTRGSQVRGEPIRFVHGHGTRNNYRDGKKRCSSCREWYPVETYQKSRANRDGLDHRCRGCNQLRMRKSVVASHGLTWDEYLAVLEEQDHRCPICLRHEDEVSLGIDHDHVTGKVRALLCRGCNSALGQFSEDPVRLRRAADFLEAHAA